MSLPTTLQLLVVRHELLLRLGCDESHLQNDARMNGWQ